MSRMFNPGEQVTEAYSDWPPLWRAIYGGEYSDQGGPVAVAPAVNGRAESLSVELLYPSFLSKLGPQVVICFYTHVFTRLSEASR